MKKTILLSVVFMVFTFYGNSFEKKIGFNLIENYQETANFSKFFTVQISYYTQNNRTIEPNTLFRNSIRVLILVVLVLMMLVIIFVPLVLAYFWLDNFFDYQKMYKNNVRANFWLNESEKANFKGLRKNIKKAKKQADFEMILEGEDDGFVKQYSNGKQISSIIQTSENIVYESTSKLIKLQELPESTWIKYCKIFTNMIGFGFGFITWVVATFFYIYINFTTIEIGLKEYFRFPFKLYENLFSRADSLSESITTEVWVNMIFIVGITILGYFIGKLLGWIIITLESKKPPIINVKNLNLH